MDLVDVELKENLPIGIIIDSEIKTLDRVGFNLALSGLDFETCVTMDCVREVVRLSPIEIIIAERNFHGGCISDIVELSRSSGKKFKVALWAERRNGITNRMLEMAGISAILIKNHPFDRILKRVEKLRAE